MTNFIFTGWFYQENNTILVPLWPFREVSSQKYSRKAMLVQNTIGQFKGLYIHFDTENSLSEKKDKIKSRKIKS